ncbi:MAG TPA: S8 family serine peptidase [Gaiellaceae bacterium]|nr:S8 family serine peptidase [Gaiellaceae bacterium]
MSGFGKVRVRGWAFAVAIGLLTLAVVPTIVSAGGGGHKARTVRPAVKVTTASDRALKKLHPALQKRYKAGKTLNTRVFMMMKGSPRAARKLLRGERVARFRGRTLVIGTVRTAQLAKLAGLKGVRLVGPVELGLTARPPGIPEPRLAKQPTRAQQQAALEAMSASEVPYSAAPPLKGSNFEALKKLNLLDAKTHNFTGAWKAGYTGTGSTVAVLDGGTDFGHPDLIGTWRTWRADELPATGPRAGWAGWPKAFDPYAALQFGLGVGVDFMQQGLNWYSLTSSKAGCPASTPADDAAGLCRTTFATRTGPARNPLSFPAPSGTVTHEYTYPKAWSKSGTARMSFHPDDHLLDLYKERPAVLVVDSNTSGVYDTVYVDLDDDYSFADEKPVTKASPASYRDINGDGYTDISGGLLYFITDGATRIPGGPDFFFTTLAASGQILAWTGDFDPAIGGHGTQTASNVVGQGVINGKAPQFADVPGGTYPGAVIGGAPDAKLAPYGDIYFSHEFSTAFAWFMTAGQADLGGVTRSVDISSNSYGDSEADNDVFDSRSMEAAASHEDSRTTMFGSTGNGAPGFGTVTSPSPYNGVSVGASTQFGGTGWDSIKYARQIVDNDVMVWSNRGPGANGSVGTDIVADGAFSPGDVTLNTVLNGNEAWTTWGGTSRSTPVAGGAAALVYQAYRAAHPGSPLPSDFHLTVREILKSSAKDLGYESYIQGSGSLDAGRAVKLAAGTAGVKVTPDDWRPGTYRGTEYPAFVHSLKPGESASKTFQVAGTGRYRVSDRLLRKTDTVRFSYTSALMAKESEYNFNAPDYLIDLTKLVKKHPQADLMVVRANYPRSQFDGDVDYDEDQAWRLLTYNWTDVNHDHNLWSDRDHDGAADHIQKTTSSNIDHNLDIDFSTPGTEIDKGEYIRFMYHRAGSQALQSFVRNPRERMDDGLLLGLQHSDRSKAPSQTNFSISIEFYENKDWRWLTTSQISSGAFNATMSVPKGTPYGMYDGAIVLTERSGYKHHGGKDRQTIVVPVALTVAAEMGQNAATNELEGSLRFGGSDVARRQSNRMYNNGSIFGANDWTWRAESGDWRFFYFDVPRTPPAGSLVLANTKWDDPAPYTDLDTLLMGRAPTHYEWCCNNGDVFGAPYSMDVVGKSPNTHAGSGVWVFNTATGGPEDFVAGAAQEGLHAAALHGVGFHGGKFDVPFETTIGSAVVNPTSVTQSTTTGVGEFDVTFESTLALPGMSAKAFGLSQPTSSTETVVQDDPNNPSSATVKKNITLANAARLTIDLDTPGDDDIDMFLVRDANGDGTFTNSEIIGSSTGSTGADEHITAVRPVDGNYQVWLLGWAISGDASTNQAPLTIFPVQGNDLVVEGIPAGPVAAGQSVTLHVKYNKPSMVAGQSYFGELHLGPSVAPSALQVPIRINR